MSAYWFLLVIALGGVFAWFIYVLFRGHTTWPKWVQVILGFIYGLSLSGFLVLLILSSLSTLFPRNFELQNRWVKCDPAYPEVCIAPGPPDLNCDDIPYANFEVLWPDPHNLDADGNGIGCER